MAVDRAKPFYACLINGDGTLCLPLGWGGDMCPWRYFLIQVLDSAELPVPQPYQDPPDLPFPHPDGMWVVDIWDPPTGWQLVELTQAQWLETQVDIQLKRWNGTDIVTRPGLGPPKGKPKVPPGLEICHWIGGGEPCFKPPGQANVVGHPTLKFCTKL